MIPRNSVLNYQGNSFECGQPTGFQTGKDYTVVAGYGDGVPRNDGTLGAFIQSPTQCVVVDDKGNYRILSLKRNNTWLPIHLAKLCATFKPVRLNPISGD